LHQITQFDAVEFGSSNFAALFFARASSGFACCCLIARVLIALTSKSTSNSDYNNNRKNPKPNTLVEGLFYLVGFSIFARSLSLPYLFPPNLASF